MFFVKREQFFVFPFCFVLFLFFVCIIGGIFFLFFYSFGDMGGP